MARVTRLAKLACFADIIFFLISVVHAKKANQDPKTLLWTSLMEGYQSSVPPPETVQVEVVLALTGVSIVTSLEMIEVSAWWRLYWRDSRSLVHFPALCCLYKHHIREIPTFVLAVTAAAAAPPSS